MWNTFVTKKNVVMSYLCCVLFSEVLSVIQVWKFRCLLSYTTGSVSHLPSLGAWENQVKKGRALSHQAPAGPGSKLGCLDSSVPSPWQFPASWAFLWPSFWESLWSLVELWLHRCFLGRGHQLAWESCLTRNQWLILICTVSIYWAFSCCVPGTVGTWIQRPCLH